MMADVAHIFGEDLQVDSNGSLLTASGSDWTTQRVLRRLLTNPGDYIWQQGYGGGLRAMVGEAGSEKTITAIILTQMSEEAGVNQDTPPVVTVLASANNYISAAVSYVDAYTGASASVDVVSGP